MIESFTTPASDRARILSYRVAGIAGSSTLVLASYTASEDGTDAWFNRASALFDVAENIAGANAKTIRTGNFSTAGIEQAFAGRVRNELARPFETARGEIATASVTADEVWRASGRDAARGDDPDSAWSREARARLFSLPSAADLVRMLMASEGTAMFSAVMPMLDLSPLATMQNSERLVETLEQEFRVRKAMANVESGISAEPNARDPFAGKDPKAVRSAAEAFVERIEARIAGLKAARTFVGQLIAFTAAGSGLNQDEAYRVLTGQA